MVAEAEMAMPQVSQTQAALEQKPLITIGWIVRLWCLCIVTRVQPLNTYTYIYIHIYTYSMSKR